MESENLTGGNSNQVRREQNTVVRQCGVWSPFIHQLLQFLTANGFTESPQLLETDGITERLTFIHGDVGNDPLKPYMLTDEIVVEAAQLLRKFHDLTQHFVIPPDAQFFLPTQPDEPHEVICHNDFAPYNCVFREGHLIGVIDFDTAAPGRRIWDIAYTVYRFVPLMRDEHCLDMGWKSPPDRMARLKLFCDTYGLVEREHLIDTIIQRLQALITYIQHKTYSQTTTDDSHHITIYRNDIDYIQTYKQAWIDAIVS